MGETNEREQSLTEIAEFAKMLLAEHFMLAIADAPPHVTSSTTLPTTSGATPHRYNTQRASNKGKRRVLQPLSLKVVLSEMEQEGLTILSSVKLFDHWYCPVHAVV